MDLYDSLNRPKDIIQLVYKPFRASIVTSALSSARNARGVADDAATDIDFKHRSLAKHEIEWHRKFTLSFACLILFFIGAPLGAIIRKGGLGMPVVFSVLFFIIYHVVSITGEKFVREGVLQAHEGMWISSLVMLPVGIYLTYKATTDSALFNIDTYIFMLKKLFRKKA
jgi:lipopolysaccharide export system permease protein